MRTFPSLIKRLFLSVARFLPLPRNSKEPALVILIYHRIGSNTDTDIDVPLPIFEEQLDYLLHNYEIVSLDEAIHIIQTGRLRDKIAVLTFDDGYYDFYANALPILQKRNIPATLYLATYFIETGKRFPWDARFSATEWPSVRPLSWKELEELARLDLITIGSHTHTHARLDLIDPDGLHQEIKMSNTLIEVNLGVRPVHFACPNGIYPQSLATVAPQYFQTVSVGGWRPNVAGSLDLYRLLRIPALPLSDLSLFAHSLTGIASFLESLAQIRYRFSIV